MMLFRLLLVLVMVCHSQARKTAPLCGRLHRKCGDKASCILKACQCDKGFYGAPLMECVRSDQFQCVVQADPHITAYASAKANLNFPCKYLLTRVQTPLVGGTPGVAFCSFEVFGFNEIINGKFFTSGVEVSLGIGDFANQIFHQQDIIKFDINEEGVESSDGGATIWGNGVHNSWKNITVQCKFDPHQGFAILHIPRCEFSLKFRPFNPDQPKGPQSRVPGISIVVGQDTIFGATELGRYPPSLCGETSRQGDNDQLYIERAKLLDVGGPSQAVLYDALNANIPQHSFLKAFTQHVLQDKDTCQKTVDDFQECTDAQKTDAIKLCSRILSKRRLVKCLGIKALNAFRGCVLAVCGDKPKGCHLYDSTLAAANCKHPRKVRRFCFP